MGYLFPNIVKKRKKKKRKRKKKKQKEKEKKKKKYIECNFHEYIN